jgi:MFS family permease
MKAQQLSELRRSTMLIVILIGTLLGPLDSAVNIAFPDITASFGIELKTIRWVVIAYVATYASLMLVFGRIGDVFGHNHVFALGLIVCIVGFAICSAASNYNWLLAARVLQGIGTAMVLSCGPALATSLFTEQQRPRILGAYAMMFGFGGAIGPSLGGWLVDLWGWPAVFWFRLPLALFALFMMLVLPVQSPMRDHGIFDLQDSLLLAITTALLLLTVTQLDQAAAYPVLVVALCAITMSVAGTFIHITKRSNNPILEPSLFSSFAFTWINVATVVVNFTGFATMLFVPYFLVQASGLSLSESGLIMAVGPLAMMTAANLGGQAVGRLGANLLAFTGAISVALGLGWISTWDESTERTLLCAALLVHGFGLGLFQVASLEFVTSSLPKSKRGVAGSLVLVMRTIGVVIAASALTNTFAHFEGSASPITRGERFVFAFQTVFHFVAVGLAAFVTISLLRTSLWLRSSR